MCSATQVTEIEAGSTMVVEPLSINVSSTFRSKSFHSYYSPGLMTEWSSTRRSQRISALHPGVKTRSLLLAPVARTMPLWLFVLRHFIDCTAYLRFAVLEATAAPTMHVEEPHQVKLGRRNIRHDAPSAPLSSPSSFQNDTSKSKENLERAELHGTVKRAGAGNKLHPTAPQREAGEPHSPDGNCLQCMGFAATPPYDRRSLGGGLSFCHEHAANTCCERKHSDHLLRRFLSSFRPEVNQGVELPVTFPPNDCRSYTAAALCSRCDARVGSGKMAHGNVAVLCPTFCRQWYMACEDEFFAAAPSGSARGLSFCTDDSLICSSLSQITRSSSAFCQLLGFEVADELLADDFDEKLGATPSFTVCYDGVPAAIALGAAALAPRKQETPSAFATDPEARNEFTGFFERVRLFVVFCLSRMRCLLAATASHPGFWLVVLLIVHGLYKAVHRMSVSLQSLINGCFNGYCSLNATGFSDPCPVDAGIFGQQKHTPSGSRQSNVDPQLNATTTVSWDQSAAAMPICCEGEAGAGHGDQICATVATESPSSADAPSAQEGGTLCGTRMS